MISNSACGDCQKRIGGVFNSYCLESLDAVKIKDDACEYFIQMFRPALDDGARRRKTDNAGTV